MKKTALFSILLLAVGMTVLAGCDPSSLDLNGGRKVKFTATSQAPTTKTAYVGTPSNGWQTISWSEGDPIGIYAPAGGSIAGTPVNPAFNLNYVYADYTIKDFSNSGHISQASLKNVGDNGLTWAGSGNAVFYAAYPGDAVMIATNNDGQLRFAFEVSATQTGNPTNVKLMPLLSKQTVENGAEVKLDFNPAFSAFEFHLKSAVDGEFTVDWVELSVEEEVSPRYPITGLCYYDLNNGSVSTDNPGYSIKFDLNATISSTSETVFTFFTLPYTLSGLMFTAHCSKTAGGVTEESKKTLRMTYSNGNWVEFPAGHKAVINGVAVDPDLWCFQTITLNGQVLDWVAESEATTSGNNPEATQFAVTGNHVHNVYQRHNNASAYKKYRQYWVLSSVDTTATVDFKIMSPSSGTYTVTPKGDVNDFTVDGTLSGTISGLTKVSFTVTPKESALNSDKKIWFVTTVSASDGTVFNIDSETQLFDMRGFHYFVTREPSL